MYDLVIALLVIGMFIVPLVLAATTPARKLSTSARCGNLPSNFGENTGAIVRQS